MSKHFTDRISLPVMQCDFGCSDCCGIVQCHGWEYQRIEAYAKNHGIVPAEQGVTCPWYQGGKCSVYEVRPFVCRLFGHVNGDRMTCSRGYKAIIPQSVELKFVQHYAADKAGGTRYLHEILGDGWNEPLMAELDKDGKAMSRLRAELLMKVMA